MKFQTAKKKVFHIDGNIEATMWNKEQLPELLGETIIELKRGTVILGIGTIYRDVFLFCVEPVDPGPVVDETLRFYPVGAEIPIGNRWGIVGVCKFALPGYIEALPIFVLKKLPKQPSIVMPTEGDLFGANVSGPGTSVPR